MLQIIPFEINLKKKKKKKERKKEKWLVALIYKTPFQENKYFLWYLTNLLEFTELDMKKISFLMILT